MHSFKLARLFDIILSLFGLLTLSPLLLILLFVGLFDTGRPLFFQVRVGCHQKTFTLVKFRSMKLNTPCTSTHMAKFGSVTTYGHFLRKSKLDELPQLWNVLIGDMSLVGPRPCLLHQHQLINLRAKMGVYSVRPGITGLSQLSHIDMSDPALLAKTDSFMIENFSLKHYFRYILLTMFGKGFGDRIKL